MPAPVAGVHVCLSVSVIPGRRFCGEPGIHNPCIPDVPLRGNPE
jgi:hypothetical protein